jgi:hemerythrin
LPKQAPRARGRVGHEDFIQKIDAFAQDFARGRVSLSLEMMGFLKDWLVEHIKGADKKYGPFLNKKGVS